MLAYRDSRVSRGIFIVFFLIVLGYAYFEARALLFGPTITIDSGTALNVQDSYVLITGTAAHIKSLAVDGEPIQVTEAGAFQEPYVLSPGLNRIVFDTKDKYGHATQKVVEIVYTPDSTSSPQATTSTTPTLSASSTAATASSTASTSSPDVAPRR